MTATIAERLLARVGADAPIKAGQHCREWNGGVGTSIVGRVVGFSAHHLGDYEVAIPGGKQWAPDSVRVEVMTDDHKRLSVSLTHAHIAQLFGRAVPAIAVGERVMVGRLADAKIGPGPKDLEPRFACAWLDRSDDAQPLDVAPRDARCPPPPWRVLLGTLASIRSAEMSEMGLAAEYNRAEEEARKTLDRIAGARADLEVSRLERKQRLAAAVAELKAAGFEHMIPPDCVAR